MLSHTETGSGLHGLLKAKTLRWAGNARLKIYGTLTCPSGKKMNMKNRVFFESEEEAVHLGYRPCGHCLPHQYKAWKGAQETG